MDPLKGNPYQACYVYGIGVTFFVYGNFSAFLAVKPTDCIPFLIGILNGGHIAQANRLAVTVGYIQLTNLIETGKLVQSTHQKRLIAVINASACGVEVFLFKAGDNGVDADI